MNQVVFQSKCVIRLLHRRGDHGIVYVQQAQPGSKLLHSLSPHLVGSSVGQQHSKRTVDHVGLSLEYTFLPVYGYGGYYPVGEMQLNN